MPLFSLSSKLRSDKSKPHRFSLRKNYARNHRSDAEVSAASTSSASEQKMPPRRQSQPLRETNQFDLEAYPLDVSSKTLQMPPPAPSLSTRSSDSTQRSTNPTLYENLSCGDNDTELSENSDSADSPQLSGVQNTRHGSCTEPFRGIPIALSGYSQLQCSTSHKNCVNNSYRDTSAIDGSSESRMNDQLSEMGTSLINGFRTYNSSVWSPDSMDLLNERISESSMVITSALSGVRSVSLPKPISSVTSEMTEANVVALQTRRAFQQMVLAMEDDSSDEYESDSDAVHRNSTHGDSSVIRLGADEYKKFQFRLRQLEELAAEQTRKQAEMERTIEQDVQDRTKKTIEDMEKQIVMYKQAKEFECEREVQRRVSEHLGRSTVSRTSRLSKSRSSSVHGAYPSSSVSSNRDSNNASGTIKSECTSLEKLLHPRRSRKRLVQMREHEEAQKRTIEQIREFVHTTESRLSQTQRANYVSSTTQLETAKSKLQELADPLLPEWILQSPPSEMIELICVLRKNGLEQERQLEKAKDLVTAAIEAREIAEAAALEAAELAFVLCAKLDSASTCRTCKLEAPDEIACRSEPQETDKASSDYQIGTPSSLTLLERTGN